MKTPYVAALDLGTTGNRAILFDRSQRPVFRAYEEFPQIFPKPGWVEHDPEAIWRSALRVLSAAVRRAGGTSKIAALGITNQRETIVLWDRRTGKPVHRAIVWQDRRTAGRCEELKKKGLAGKIHGATGLFTDPYFSATKLEWLLNRVPGARKKAERGDLLAGTVDTWVAWKLSGGALHVTDASNASRTMLFGLESLEWDPWLLKTFGVPRAALPKVVATSGLAGGVDKNLFKGELPIASLVGDQQAASFAQGCFAPGTVKNTYGTGLFLVECTGKKPRFSKDLLTTIAWSDGTRAGTEYAVEGSVFIGGAAVQWLRDGLGLFRKSSQVEALAKKASSNDGVYFVPALSGLGAPYWDPRARGTILGLTRGTNRSHVARAALESIAYQTRDVMESMRRDTGHAFKRLRVDGGAAANDFLMQFQADLLGIPVERPRVLETTALGAAGLAGLAAGFWKSRAEFDSMRRVERVFRPKRRASETAPLYARWKEAVRRASGWAAVALLLFAAPASAETLILKSGQTREGKIVEKTDDYLVMIVHGVKTPYYFEEIDNIDGLPAREAVSYLNTPAPAPAPEPEPAPQPEPSAPAPEPKLILEPAAEPAPAPQPEPAKAAPLPPAPAEEPAPAALMSIPDPEPVAPVQPPAAAAPEIAPPSAPAETRASEAVPAYEPEPLPILPVVAPPAAVDETPIAQPGPPAAPKEEAPAYKPLPELESSAAPARSLGEMPTEDELLKPAPKDFTKAALTGSPRDLALLSFKLFNERRYEEAILVDEKALDMPLDNRLVAHFALNASSAHLELGVPAYALGRDPAHLKQAIKYGQMCVDADPVSWRAFANIGSAQMNLGKLEEADRNFREARRYAEPESPYYRQLVMQQKMVENALLKTGKRENS